MPPRELPAEALDADELDRAEARAEAARARATRLRELADAASSDDPADTADDGPGADVAPTAAATTTRRFRLRRPGRKAAAVATAVVCVGASLAASGYVVWHHHQVAQQRQHAAEFAATARDAVLKMLSIKSSTARADVQRFVDDTTGQFKAAILVSAEDFVKLVEQSKSDTKGSVQAVAVQSMTDDSATVLVAARSEVTKQGEDKPESRPMRIVVNVRRDGEQLKVSSVEIVP